MSVGILHKHYSPIIKKMLGTNCPLLCRWQWEFMCSVYRIPGVGYRAIIGAEKRSDGERQKEKFILGSGNGLCAVFWGGGVVLSGP